METQLTQALSIKRSSEKEWPCYQMADKYDLTEIELGRGTYGSVYKAKKR